MAREAVFTTMQTIEDIQLAEKIGGVSVVYQIWLNGVWTAGDTFTRLRLIRIIIMDKLDLADINPTVEV